MAMQLVSFFSGIGGFELAGEWVGWDIVASCEINPFGLRVLKYYWSHAYHHTDVKTINYEEIKRRLNPAKSTVFVAGFPCQPFSTAGKRLGTEDDRYGWPDCIKAIRELRPGWCVLENVRGITNWNGGLVFDQVQADLEAEGYEVLPFLLPACAVNAPHRRDRIWFVAYSGGKQFQERAQKRDTENTSEDRTGVDNRTERQGNIGIIANTTKPNKQRHRLRQECEGLSIRGRYSKGDGFANFPTQSPLCSRNDGFSSRLAGITFSKHRNESLKAYGNAIVPQVAYEIFKAIAAMHSIPTP